VCLSTQVEDRAELGRNGSCLFFKGRVSLLWSSEEPIPELQMGALLCSYQLLLFGEEKKTRVKAERTNIYSMRREALAPSFLFYLSVTW